MTTDMERLLADALNGAAGIARELARVTAERDAAVLRAETAEMLADVRLRGPAEERARAACPEALPDQPTRPAHDWPPWFRPSKYAPTQARNVARGCHPMGAMLGPEDETCGSCRHVERHEYSSTYIKCAVSRQSKAPATDIRLKWRACERWECKL